MNSKTIRILLVGKDGRTDALAAACTASRWKVELYAYSDFRIPGLDEKCEHVEVGPTEDTNAVLDYAIGLNPDLVIVGPEEPLEAGLVDSLEKHGLPCFGPTRAHAMIETSKSWARELVSEVAIDVNPQFKTFATAEGLIEYLNELKDFVIKPDGLTGGKGVRVLGDHLESIDEGFAYACSLIDQGMKVVVEERLDGEEFSLQTITDGSTFVHCPLVQDHKRAYKKDRGPNTGGMGSYSCADHSLPFLDDADVELARRTNELVIKALCEEIGTPYRGVLYGGFIVTRNGIRLIEYNARFGDPEAMNVLPLLEADFVDICLATVRGNLHSVKVSFSKKATVCKYVVPNGYPERKEAGSPVEVTLPSNAWGSNLSCYWAAVNRIGSENILTGSRALAFVGIGETVPEAEHWAELGAQSVKGPVRSRSDIGTIPALEARTEHMKRIRARQSSSAE